MARKPRVVDELEREFGDGLDLAEMEAEAEEVEAETPPPASIYPAMPMPVPMPPPQPQGQHFRVPAATSPPMWAQAAAQGGTGCLEVQRIVHGQPQNVGKLGLKSTLDDLLSRWPVAGTYWLTPTALDGRRMGEPVEITVADDHEALLKVLAARANVERSTQMGGGAAPAAMPAEFMAYLTKLQIDAAEREERARKESAEREARMEATLREERAAVAAERAKLAEEKLHLGVLNTSQSTELQMKLMERDNARQAESSNQFLAMIQAAQAAEQARYQAQLEAERRRSDEERMRWERERESAKEEDRRRHEDDEKREGRRLEELNRERERDREHMRLLMQVAQTKNEAGDPIAIVEKLIERGAPLIENLKALGVIGGAKEEKKDWPELVAQVVTAALAAKAASDQAKMIEAGMMGPEEGEDDTGEVQVTHAPPHQLPGPQGYPQGMQQGPQLSVVPGGAGPVQPVTLADMVGNMPPPGPPIVQQRPLADRIGAALGQTGMDDATAKSARRGVRELIHRLRLTDKAQWQELVTGALMANPAVIAYCGIVSVHWALIEGQADEQLAAAITDAVFSNPLVPANFPRKHELPL